MKRFLLVVVVLAMMLSVQLTAMAAGLTMSFQQYTAGPGQTVYLSVSLPETVQGNSVAITITEMNEETLTWVPNSSSWSKDAVLKDFGMSGNAGVWTTEQATNLSGEICVLAFKIKDDAQFTNTKVQCSMVVKNGTETVGTYQGEAILRASCTHEYGKWENVGQIGHNRVCKHCGANQTKTHNWDQVVTTQDPNTPSMGIKTYTCSECGGTKTENVDWNPGQTGSTAPDHDHTSTPTTSATGDGHSHDHTTSTTGAAGSDNQVNGVLLGVLALVGGLLIVGGAVTAVILRAKKTKGSGKK